MSYALDANYQRQPFVENRPNQAPYPVDETNTFQNWHYSDAKIQPFDESSTRFIANILNILCCLWILILLPSVIIFLTVSLPRLKSPRESEPNVAAVALAGASLMGILALVISSCCCVGPSRKYRASNICHLTLMSIFISSFFAASCVLDPNLAPTVLTIVGFVMLYVVFLQLIVISFSSEKLAKFLFSWKMILASFGLILIAILIMFIADFYGALSGKQDSTYRSLRIAVACLMIILISVSIVQTLALAKIMVEARDDIDISYFVFNLLVD